MESFILNQEAALQRAAFFVFASGCLNLFVIFEEKENETLDYISFDFPGSRM